MAKPLISNTSLFKTSMTPQQESVSVVYNEDENKWSFELNGRMRTRNSLKEAREDE